MSINQQIQQQLIALETQLRYAGLWSDTPPDAKAMQSQEPFCVDSMAIEQWLQWIFIPKMQQMSALPDFQGFAQRSDIHTMVDYIFTTYHQKTDDITMTIKKIDALLNENINVHREKR